MPRLDRPRGKLGFGLLFGGGRQAGSGAAGSSAWDSPGFSDRAEALARYRGLKAVMERHFDAADRFRSGQTIKEAAKRIGLVSGGKIAAENAGEMRLVDDLVFFGSNNGRSGALGRYARTVSFPEGTDETFVLKAMRESSFHFIECKHRHRLAGVMVEDVVRQEELWLMDEALEASFAPGLGLAARLARHGPFHVALGVAVPMTKSLFLEALLALDGEQGDLPSRLDHPRVVEMVYSLAVSHRVMRGLRVVERE